MNFAPGFVSVVTMQRKPSDSHNTNPSKTHFIIFNHIGIIKINTANACLYIYK